MSSYRLIEAERTSFPVHFMCRMLGVSRSGYYDWRGRPPSSRNRENATLTSKIREVQRRSRETYGSPRVHAELKALGTRCSRKRVARLMRQAGLRGCIRGRRKSTTRRSGRAVPAKDLLQRSFAATEVDRVWVADITYVPTQEGFLYLAFILDVYSRRIVGWAMERMLRTTPVRMLTGDIVTSCTYQPAFRAMRSPRNNAWCHGREKPRQTKPRCARRLMAKVWLPPTMEYVGSGQVSINPKGGANMILVTGGTGYIGSVLVPELLALGETVRVVDTQWFDSSFDFHERLELIEADLRHCDTASLLDDVTGIVHLAGLSNDPTADFAPDLNSQSNVLATRRLAQAAAERAELEQRKIRFILASTCSVYYSPTVAGDVNVMKMTEDLPVAPTANYSKTKRLAEIEVLHVAARQPLFSPTLLRQGTIFGLAPRMRFDLVVNVLVLHAWRNHLLTVHGSGEAWRPLLHIRDAVDAYLHLLWAPTQQIHSETYNLVHKNYRVLELAHWIAEILEQHRGADINVRRDRSAGDSLRSYYVDGEKITKALGFRPERGVAQAVLEIWDALERGEFGDEPENDLRYFNIRWLKETMAKEVVA